MPRSIARWSCGIFLLYRCAERWFTSRSENALCVLGCLKDGGADREEVCRTRNLRLTLPAEFILLVEHAPSTPGPSEAPGARCPPIQPTARIGRPPSDIRSQRSGPRRSPPLAAPHGRRPLRVRFGRQRGCAASRSPGSYAAVPAR